MPTIRPRTVAAATLVALSALAPAAPAIAAPGAGFRVTSENPTAAELNDLVQFIVTTPASDADKAANVEGGMSSVVVPRTVYTLGLFRAPRGSSEVTGPLARNGNRVTGNLTASSVGIPTVRMKVDFVREGGNWKLASSSMCEGVKAVGLPIFCNA